MDEESRLISSDILRAHRDPFFNECRAYGQPVEAGQNGKIAIRCYGHMSIPAEMEEELAERFDVHSRYRFEEDYAKPVSERQPFRAVVKELIRDPMPLTLKVVGKMLKDLKTIRRLGVFPMDVCARNYEAGLLVDMDIAMTRTPFSFQGSASLASSYDAKGGPHYV